MKYIILKLEDKHYPFVFSKSLNHSDFCDIAKKTKMYPNGGSRNWERLLRNSVCVGAGFISKDGTCHGRSESLGIDSRPEDTKIFAEEN